ncbi:hypothetical protein H8K32_16695 [Undibacterium jejuense]|uniref:HNH nuclease domain-containing protein n=1 Tax=Undibacterium jejuense TaxID=1344949 RepID=A0A923HL75_9BURK|nr:hypothetical protein [Undibacterium jejuense]MBC3863747.1 hypothetical protein [Undibacterium jejuense]
MINIRDHLNRADADQVITNLADDHWKYLIKSKSNGTRGKHSLVARCESAKGASSTPRYLKEYAENRPEKAKRHEEFFKYVLSNNFIKLREIIVGTPTTLVSLNKEIYSILKDEDIYTVVDGVLKQTRFGKFLSETIFPYGAYRKTVQCKKTLTKLDFTSATCPYCNYTRLDVTKCEKKKAYLDLDHFFLKSKHPFFALSFFNLVPSCHSCNSTDRGVTDFSLDTHINPFYESFDQIYKFSFPPAFFHGSSDEFQIDNNGTKKNDITPTTFNIRAKYQNRIQDLKDIVDDFNKYKHYLNTPNEEIFVALIMKNVPPNHQGILKFELSKIKRDLLKELDSNRVLKIC